MQSDFSPGDLEFARELAEVLLEQFEDAQAGGFFFTARDHEHLIHRPKPGQDNATPSGNAVAAWALTRLAALTSEDRYARAAERTLEAFYPTMRDQAAGFAAMAIALNEALKPVKVLVLRGERDALATWQQTIAREYLPDTTVLAIADAVVGLPPVLDKPKLAEPVNGWLCRGVTCLPPVSNLVDLLTTCKENQ